MMPSSEVLATVKRYVLEEFLAGEPANVLSDSTPLISGGILDSIATIKLVTFLEETYQIRLEAHEVSADYLDTPEGIAKLVEAKRMRPS